MYCSLDSCYDLLVLLFKLGVRRAALEEKCDITVCLYDLNITDFVKSMK